MSSTRPDRNAPAVNRRRKLLLPGGVSLLEMVLAVSMLGAMTGAALEWQAFEAARAQAVGAARQLASLAHLVRDYAALQPRHYELADHRTRNMGISDSSKTTFGATYAPPAGGLMAGRWPTRFADLRTLLPATFSDRILLPADPAAEEEEETQVGGTPVTGPVPGGKDIKVFQILGSDDITLAEGVMGTARFRVGGIALNRRAAVQLMAVLLRRQGLAALVEEHSVEGTAESLALTLTLMPQRSLRPSAGARVEVDFGYATDLIVAGVVATDVKAHEAMIPYTHAPFDFTMHPNDPAAVRALEYVAGPGADATTASAKPVLDGMRHLGGYSGFFYDQCGGRNGSVGHNMEAWDPTFQKGARAWIGPSSSTNPHRDGGLVLRSGVQMRKCNSKDQLGSSLYSQFRVVGARSGVHSAPLAGLRRTQTRDELLPQDSGPWGGEENPHLLADRKSLICTAAACGTDVPSHTDVYYNMDSFGHNESASFAANAIVVSANLPGVPWPGDYKKRWFRNAVRDGRTAFHRNHPYRIAWLREDPPSPGDDVVGRPSVRWGFIDPVNSMEMAYCGKGHNFAPAQQSAQDRPPELFFLTKPTNQTVTWVDFQVAVPATMADWDKCRSQMPLWEIPTTGAGDSIGTKRTIWAFEVARPDEPDNIEYKSRMIASDGGLAYTAEQVQGMPLLGSETGSHPAGAYQLGGRAFGDRSVTRLFQLEYMLKDLTFAPRTAANWRAKLGQCAWSSNQVVRNIPDGSTLEKKESKLKEYLQAGNLATTTVHNNSWDDLINACNASPVSAYVEDYRHFTDLDAAQIKELEAGLWAFKGNMADYSRIFHFNRSYYPPAGQSVFEANYSYGYRRAKLYYHSTTRSGVPAYYRGNSDEQRYWSLARSPQV